MATQKKSKTKQPAKKVAAKKPAPKKVVAKPVKKVTAAPKKKVAAKKPAPKKVVAKKPVASKAMGTKSKQVTKQAVEPKKLSPVLPKKVQFSKPTNDTQFTHSELFDTIKNYCGFTTRSEAKGFYENFAGMIQHTLKNGYKILLPGVGKLQVRKTKQRNGINPSTRQPIVIPARKKVSFTPIKALKEAVL